MPKIAIIGWYGTETIGDRAILAGLFSLFSQAYPDFQVNIGAIFPFLTERTLLEDYNFLRVCSGKDNLSISIFNSIEPKELRAAIRNSDILVVGGGPLFDGYCVFMLEYALKYAKKAGKITMILGCGMGPLYKKRFIKSVITTINHADVCVFRDEASKEVYVNLSGRKADTVAAIDPAVFAAEKFMQIFDSLEVLHDSIAASIIKFPSVYKIGSGINEKLMDVKALNLLRRIQEESGKKLILVPMHYFKVGGDDRIYMNKLRQELGKDIIHVQNEPLTTYQTMKLFASSYLCFGMRFHSVVLQTVLCGRNIIIDYTDPRSGKIGSFLDQIDAREHYSDNYINLQGDSVDMRLNLNPNKFSVNIDTIRNYKDIYRIKMTT